MSTETPNEDYVLVHKSKVRISRARKFVMGTMAIGAVAAITGAGTFASFSASTTNDATFQTGLVRLSNTVGSGTTCFSSTNAANDLDVNDESCDSLFDVAFGPGSTQSVNLTIKNEGTAPGSLKLFGTGTGTGSACTGAANTAGFDEVQTVTTTGTGAETYTLTFDGQSATGLAWDATAATVKSALEGLSNIGANEVVVTRTGSGPYVYRIRFVGTLAKLDVAKLSTGTFSGTNTAAVAIVQGGLAANTLTGTNSDDLCTLVKMTIQETQSDFSTNVSCKLGGALTACPAVGSSTATMSDVTKFDTGTIDLGTGFEPGASKYYKVSFVLPHNAPNSVSGCSGSDQFGDNGVGCDNPAMNGNAALGIRWQLQV